MSITEFLLERIAEDEYEANVCLDQYRRGDGGSTPRWTRQLAECAAKRAIVAEWEDTETGETWLLEGADAGYALAIDHTLRLLAAVYADHQDYRGEWKVGA